MVSSSNEGKATASFTAGVSSSAEREIAIDENASTVSLAPNICVVPDLSVAAREGKEGVRDFLDDQSGEETACSCHFLGS